MHQFTSMTKQELRAACRERSVSYSNLNNDGMRQALREFEAFATALNEPAPAAVATPEPAPAAKPAVDRHSGTGIKVEKNRETRNGVTRPSAGGVCREVWDALDAIYQDEGDEKGVMPTAAMVRELAAREGWNANNASIEYYNWRKFNGISGRVK